MPAITVLTLPRTVMAMYEASAAPSAVSVAATTIWLRKDASMMDAMK